MERRRVAFALAAAGVLAPGPGDHPDPPGRLTITTGPHRLQVGWGSAVPGGHDPRDAVGYDVRWGTGGQLDHERLTAQPAAELDGLPDGQDTRIGVRAIDAFGQRSDPATGSGRPGRDD